MFDWTVINPLNERFFRWLQCGVKIETDLYSKNYDGIILVSGKPPGCDEPEPFKTVLYAASQIDAALGEEGAVLPISVPAKRLIYSPAASASLYSLDYYDVRSFAKAARDGMKRWVSWLFFRPLFSFLFIFMYFYVLHISER